MVDGAEALAGGIEQVRLGRSELSVSRIALGSWRTFERMERADALAVMAHARARGVTFLDDARYNDETGRAPLPTGWSEVLFGELVRAAQWSRDELVIANKLWWEFWPAQDAAGELAASLERMRFDHVDLIYTLPPPEGLPIEDAVAQVGGLLSSGAARAWGVANWTAEQVAAGQRAAAALGIAPPCAAQLPYSVVRREWVEDPAMVAALAAGGTSVVPSSVLEGGVLTGKYAEAGAPGRHAGELSDPAVRAGAEAGERVAALARDLGVAPATLAVAFALGAPSAASVLVGATSPAQLDESIAALALHDRLAEADIARLRAIPASV